MTAHLSDEQIHAYRQRSLAAAELLDLSRHIGACEACRVRLASPEEWANGIRAFRSALKAETGTVHPGYEEFEAYLDDTMAAGDRLALEAHTRDCQSCAADLDEIRVVREELHPARRTEFWKGLLGWRGGLALAGAAACALLAIVLVRAPAPQGREAAQAANVPTPQPPAQSGPVIRDGSHVISIAANGTLEGLDQLPPTDRAALQQALMQGRIERPPSLADLVPNGGVLLGAPGEPARGKLLEPLSAVVESQRPTFRWEPISGTTYRVSVYDGDYNMVAESGRITATEWQTPNPLRRGVRYSWQITVSQNGAEFTMPRPPAPEARFRILGEAEEANLTRARMQSGDSHLVLGILYARAGMLKEAEQELQALRRQNPASAEVANLLASVERLRGAAQ